MKPGIIKNIEVSQSEYFTSDEIFALKVRSVVEKNISNSSFNIVLFAEQMKLSPASLYRRISELFNVAPRDYIHQVRLKHAERMLMKKVGNVSVVARAVGFKDPKYFTKCFKMCYGVTPSQILKQNSIVTYNYSVLEIQAESSH